MIRLIKHYFHFNTFKANAIIKANEVTKDVIY